MKVIITDIPYASKHENELRALRLKGTMVCLLAECNRRKLMRSFRTLANYYIADSGEFLFSGCFTLHNQRSAHLDRVISVLNRYSVRYAFRLEYANACGGLEPYACSDESLSNEEYSYMVSFDSEEQKNSVISETDEYCTFHMLNDHEAYIRFHDIHYADALHALFENQKINENDAEYRLEEVQL